jgi:uncharacterized protein YgiB involved in biofilm formation
MPREGRRRKSAYVGFSVISLSAALSGCDQAVREPGAQDARIYTSVADCEREAPAKDCQDGWTAAQGEQTATAPLFSDRAECETQWGPGRCAPGATPVSARYFVPAIAGFMLVKSLQAPRLNCGPGTGVSCSQGGGTGGWGGSGGSGGGWVTTGHPVYVGSGGKVFAGWQPVGEVVRAPGGALSIPRTVTVVEESGRVSPGITTRGGFGRAFGGFGGGRGG